MTLRTGFVIIAVGLAAGSLLAGCGRPFLDPGSPAMPAEGVGLEMAHVGVTGRVSPYHAQPVTLGVGPAPRQETAIERVSYPVLPPEPELVPPPAVLVEPPRAAPPAPAPEVVTPPPTEEPLLTALRCLLARRPDEAIVSLRRYDELNQDMLLGLLALAVRLTQGGLDRSDPQEVSHVLDQLDSLAAVLRSLAPLAIEKMCFCRAIRDFGDYDPLPEGYAFQAGRDGQAGEYILLYVEVRNFSSKPCGPFHETRLATRLEIRDLRGERVWLSDAAAKEPGRSHTPRRECFLTCAFSVPAKLPPGRYTLWVEVKDVTRHSSREVPPHRVARRSLDFQVTAGGPLAGR
ncbi:MAG TPA: hypothetical protein VNK04_09210 [Gemmataceae bacterium]|nr:hypothetical protein [Gemmataceae bacterium]